MGNEVGICGGCIIGMLILYLVSIFIVSIDMITDIMKYILLGIFLIILLMLCSDSERKQQLNKYYSSKEQHSKKKSKSDDKNSLDVNTKKGYIYCKKCVRYYVLQEGEIPENFETCQCGGKLKYYETLDEIFKL